jgi:hypothetical protein
MAPNTRKVTTNLSSGFDFPVRFKLYLLSGKLAADSADDNRTESRDPQPRYTWDLSFRNSGKTSDEEALSRPTAQSLL